MRPKDATPAGGVAGRAGKRGLRRASPSANYQAANCCTSGFEVCGYNNFNPAIMHRRWR